MKNELKKSFDLNELKSVSNGDKQFVAEMVGVFIKITQEGMDEMELALKEKNNKALTECIHKIAPPCRHMGAIKLLNILNDIRNNIENSGIDINIETLLARAKQEINYVSDGLKEEIANNNISG